ncbi:uncharacterized protein LOC135387922 isoform X2 [Ornithodoros turicata]|uniref:uncharacterized protein LOC135387922 isoform X2 n=1 Tax=Ornithodoros turicata TaxID=34597 RepID=UPI00313964DA
MEVDLDDDVICVEELPLNSICKKLLEQKQDSCVLSQYECVLRDLEFAFVELKTLNDIPVLLPDAIQLLSSVSKAAIFHLLSRSAVESYINCLLTLHILAHCFQRCLSCKTELGQGKFVPKCSPDIFQLAGLLCKLEEKKQGVPAAAISAFLRCALRVLENHSIYADKALHEIIGAVSSLARSNNRVLPTAVIEALCDLFQKGRLKLDTPLARSLLEASPTVLERLILLRILQQLNSGADAPAGDAQLLGRFADCSVRSSYIFRRCLSILLTIHSKSSQESRIREITLGFLQDVKAKLDSESWVLLFDEDLQPLIIMLQLPWEGFGENLKTQYGLELSQLALRMLESNVLDTGSLSVILHIYPPCIRQYCNL